MLRSAGIPSEGEISKSVQVRGDHLFQRGSEGLLLLAKQVQGTVRFQIR